MATKMITVLLGLTLVLAVACGSAAPEPTAVPDPTATQAADAAPADEPTAVPVESDTSQPTPTPQAAAPPAEAEVNPGKLTIMVGNLGNERYDSSFSSGAPGGINYGKVVHGFLISSNERVELVPGIASQWGLSEDGLTWTFTIRTGVKFHDGSELTSGDVLWSFQHYVGPQAFEYTTTDTLAGISRVIDRVELNGPDQVSLTTKQPVPQLVSLFSEAGGSWVGVMPRRAEQHDTAVELAYDNNPIGAGFMSLAEHVPASVMSFERFDDFYYQPKNGFPEDKRVNFQSLDMFLVPEEATRVAALRSGEADLVPASLATKEQVEAGGGRLVFGPEGVFLQSNLLGCYEVRFPCHDKRVRQALDYAIDKELFRDQLFGGPEVFQIKGWDGITPSTIGYTSALDPWPQDTAKARRLLEEAGYPGGKGFGKLIINTHPSSSMPFLVESAQLAAESWERELGLDVEIRVGDGPGIRGRWRSGELNGQIYWRDNDTRLDATTLWDARYADPESATRMHEDAELFRLASEVLDITNPDRRAEASKEWYKRLRDESYNLGFGYINIPWGVGPRVLTWQPYPMAVYPSALHTITLK